MQKHPKSIYALLLLSLPACEGKPDPIVCVLPPGESTLYCSNSGQKGFEVKIPTNKPNAYVCIKSDEFQTLQIYLEEQARDLRDCKKSRYGL